MPVIVNGKEVVNLELKTVASEATAEAIENHIDELIEDGTIASQEYVNEKLGSLTIPNPCEALTEEEINAILT